MATIRDVAVKAGVSISTVSLAMNQPQRVAAGTRARIYEAIETLSFVPRAEAAARARRAVRRVGVIGPFSTHEAAMRRLGGLLEASPGLGTEVVVYDEVSASQIRSPLLHILPRTEGIDALAVISLPVHEDFVHAIEERELPCVLVDCRHPGLPSVRADDHQGGRQAARHLRDGGALRPAFLGESQRSGDYVSPSTARLRGFVADWAEHGIDVPQSNRLLTAHDFHAARRAVRDLLDADTPPDAVFAASDLLAAAVLAAADDAGIDVPGRLQVLGYDGSDLAEALQLSTIDQSLSESGRIAMELLVDRPQDQPLHDRLLRLRLVARRSTHGWAAASLAPRDIGSNLPEERSLHRRMD